MLNATSAGKAEKEIGWNVVHKYNQVYELDLPNEYPNNATMVTARSVILNCLMNLKTHAFIYFSRLYIK